MILQRARGVLKLNQLIILGLALLTLLAAVFGAPLLNKLAPVCTHAPAYGPDMAADTRRELDLLFENGLLYCADLQADVATVPGPVYWGSDGLTSLLYFTFTERTGLGISDYAFGIDAIPPYVGAAQPEGFVPDWAGQRATVNQAPADAHYFLFRSGAPGNVDPAVKWEIHGPARLDATAARRDALRDLNLIWSWLTGEARSGRVDARLLVAIPISPERWQKVVRRRVNPIMATEKGDLSLRLLTSVDSLQEPTWYHLDTSLLGSSLWVAGVVSGTFPSLVLAGTDGKAGEAEPIDGMVWQRADGDLRLADFAFPPQPAGAQWEARYWNDPRRGSDTPDKTWPVQFP